MFLNLFYLLNLNNAGSQNCTLGKWLTSNSHFERTLELVLAKDKEKELRTTMSRLQTDIERERAKVKSIQEKVTLLSNKTKIQFHSGSLCEISISLHVLHPDIQKRF